MRELLGGVVDRLRAGPMALARVVDVTGAGPREVGAAMAVTGEGEVIGSISGGCVEAAVVDAAAGVLRDGRAVLERYGVADPDGIAVGLTCGGEMEVFIERAGSERSADLTALQRDIRHERPVALVTTLDEAPRWHVLRPGTEGGPHGVSRDAWHAARAGRTGTVGADDCQTAFPARAFVHSFVPPARMILAGANDFVRALSRLGAQLGYRVTVVDARETFTTSARFPAAHEVVVDWPHRYLRREHDSGRLDARTVVVVLTHDSKFDVPTLATALGIEDLAFVGALGSRRTHADRTARLVEAGVPPERLRHLRSPVGLDLNARTPEETAVSIAAQVLADTGGGSARPLIESTGAIHH
ncbi:XdhC family protein [Nocardia mexicana]|uniref:Xanthine dehydrogenase accessory factor n=1 Tax=Nocardia mexicana TaxID=279262 RepID=A0A370GZ11_9NOCA|nr:XdhC/CoxI family protein [Nocardia mexicana]RDI48881.1 xanthine dehydrogenase accessory factor [Nocardia mexicana]